MRTRFAAVIGMILIITSAVMPVQTAAGTGSNAAGNMQYSTALAEEAAHIQADYSAKEFRYLGNGWHLRNGTWYYVRNGRAVTGWEKVNGKWYYLASDGAMKTGWLKDGGKWYYLSSSGAMKTGWLKDNGKWYYLSSSGAMKTGWVKVKGKWYYLSSNGAMKTGWLKDKGKWYYLSASGAMKKGWLKTGGRIYYLTSSGARKTGWLTIRGKKYYFGSNGVLDEAKSAEANAAPAAQTAADTSASATGSAAGNSTAEDTGGGKSEAQADSGTTKAVKTKGELVAEYALQFVGNPYVYGGCSLTKGTDCSGFVMLIYRHFGVSLPHYDAAIRARGKSVSSLKEAKAGDIICYYGHVAIYLEDGRIVHASNSRDGIKISDRADYRTIAGIRRIFD